MDGDLLQHLDTSVRQSLRNKEYSSINHFLHTVESLEKPLSAISLPKAAHVEKDQVYKDITREEFVVNGNLVEGSRAQQSLQSMLENKCGLTNAASEATAYQLLEASSRTISGGDSFFVVQDLFGSASLMIKQANAVVIPIEIVVNETGRHTVCCENVYEVFQHAELEDMQEGATASVSIHTAIMEVLQQGTGSNSGMRTRSLCITAKRLGENVDAEFVSDTLQQGSEYTVTLDKGDAGLGVYFIQEGQNTIVDRKRPFFKDSAGREGPAEASGKIKPGDQLIGVDGKVVEGMSFDAVVNVLKACPRGRGGTKLRFKRGGAPPPNISLFQRLQKGLEETRGGEYECTLEKGKVRA
jgi:hypothetical protein